VRLLVNESEFALTPKMSEGIFKVGRKTVTWSNRVSEVIALALGARTIVTADHPFHLDIYDNYR